MKELTIKDFAEIIQEKLEERNNGIETKYEVIRKQNDTEMNALLVNQQVDKVFCVIYLEKLFAQYKDGTDIERILDQIINTIETERLSETVKNNLKEKIYDYEAIKGNITIKLVNLQNSKNYLEDKVYVPYLDLAVMFRIVVDDITDGVATIAISKNLFKKWNVDIEDMYKQALQNMTSIFPTTIVRMADIISEIFEMGEEASDIVSSLHNQPEMYVLSNEKRLNGATNILEEGILKKFADEKESNKVYIIPSSVHELILIPSTKEFIIDENCVNEMILNVNEYDVEKQDILSNHVYVYEREEDKINY